MMTEDFAEVTVKEVTHDDAGRGIVRVKIKKSEAVYAKKVVIQPTQPVKLV